MNAHMTAEPDGVAFVEALRDGVLQPPPMIGLVPAQIIDVAPGLVVMESAPSGRHDNGAGMAHGGWSMTLLDTAMGLATRTLVGADLTCVTTDLTVRFHRPMLPQGGPYRIVARVLASGSRSFATIAHVEAGDGRIHASATGAFQPVPMPARPPVA